MRTWLIWEGNRRQRLIYLMVREDEDRPGWDPSGIHNKAQNNLISNT